MPKLQLDLLKEGKNFQLILLTVFIVAGVVAVVVFSMQRAGSGAGVTALEVWGVLPSDDARYLVAGAGSDRVTVSYKEVPKDGLREELLEAIAAGNSPDLLIFDHESLLLISDLLEVIPFESFSKRSYQDSFVNGTDIFSFTESHLALPVAIDPLVLYWNRTLLALERFVDAPEYWDELPQYTEELTRTDGNNISLATMSLGTYHNITHAKDILSTLLMQVGVPITEYRNGNLEGELNPPQASGYPAEAVMRFYSEFSDPRKSVYTWNRALPESRTMFVANELALYPGYASEYKDIQKENSNLDFDAALFPQVRDTLEESVYGKIYAVGVMRQAPHRSVAFQSMGRMVTNRATIEAFSERSNLAPVRRDMLEEVPEDPAQVVFNRSAVITKVWFDPDYEATDTIFGQLVENIIIGNARIRDALRSAEERIGSI